jgi:hypothetical protein
MWRALENPEPEVSSEKMPREGLRFFPSAGVEVSMSFGFAEYSPGDNLDDVLARTDVEPYGERREEGRFGR